MNIVSTTISGTKAKVLAAYTDDTNITNVEITVLPTPEVQVGKQAELYIDTVTKELTHEYVDKPLSETEQVLNNRLLEAEEQNALMLLAMVEGGLM